jgi:predicted dehydrogenase
MITLGIVGCGDVAFRTYLPGLAPIADRVRVAATADPQRDRAERLAAEAGDARPYVDYHDLLAHPGLDAVLNLTPAPFHRDVNAAALEAGLHVFSEKPLAADVAQAQFLIEQARRRDRLLLVAPAVMATSRFRWLRDEFAAGRFGRPTLAVAQMANMGPAAWRDYKGDPAVFYSKAVGPLLDTGVYVLHAVTGLFGPARRLEAFAGVAIPEREVLIPGREGQTVRVEANDHVLLQLDFGGNAFAQILSSFAVPRSRVPALEVHGSGGSVSVSQEVWYAVDEPIDLFVSSERDDLPGAAPDWVREAPPTRGPVPNLIQAGPAHLVACLEGAEEPVLTAEHATHVLEIVLAADRSAREGRALDLETTF